MEKIKFNRFSSRESEGATMVLKSDVIESVNEADILNALEEENVDTKINKNNKIFIEQDGEITSVIIRKFKLDTFDDIVDKVIPGEEIFQRLIKDIEKSLNESNSLWQRECLGSQALALFLKDQNIKIGVLIPNNVKGDYAFCDNVYMSQKFLQIDNFDKFINKTLLVKVDTNKKYGLRAERVMVCTEKTLRKLIKLQDLKKIFNIWRQKIEEKREDTFAGLQASAKSELLFAIKNYKIKSLNLGYCETLYDDSSCLYGGHKNITFKFGRSLTLQEFKDFLSLSGYVVEAKKTDAPICQEEVDFGNGELFFNRVSDSKEPSNIWSYTWRGEWSD